MVTPRRKIALLVGDEGLESLKKKISERRNFFGESS